MKGVGRGETQIRQNTLKIIILDYYLLTSTTIIFVLGFVREIVNLSVLM